MGVIRACMLVGVMLAAVHAADLTIDGTWSAIEPTPQPTRLIESPFALELDAGPDDIVTWTWDQGLSVWKPEEHRLEVAAGDGVYRIGWTVRTINFAAGRIDTEAGSLIFQTGDPQSPTDPTDPPPDPDVGDERITELAASAVKATGDTSTAKALGQFYIDWATTADRTADKPTLRDSLRRGSGGVLLRREGDADWETTWRVPLSALVNDASATEYIDLMGFAGRQLLAASSAAKATDKQPRIVTLYTRPGCAPCERWKREDRAKFTTAGFEFREVTANAGAAVPYFKVQYQGETYWHDGYLSAKSFNSLVRQRKRK